MREPHWLAVPVFRPVLSRNVVWCRDEFAVAVALVRPELSRNVVRLPNVDAVPVMRPVLSRKVVVPPDVVAVPVVRPVRSRKVVRLPDVVAEPLERPVRSVNVARSPSRDQMPNCRDRLSLPGLEDVLLSAKARLAAARIAMVTSALPMQALRAKVVVSHIAMLVSLSAANPQRGGVVHNLPSAILTAGGDLGLRF